MGRGGSTNRLTEDGGALEGIAVGVGLVGLGGRGRGGAGSGGDGLALGDGATAGGGGTLEGVDDGGGSLFSLSSSE